MNRSLRIASVLVLVGVAGAGAVLVKDHPARGAPAPAPSGSADRVVPVTTAVVKKEDVPIVVEGLGTVTPLQTVNVRPQVDGRLDTVSFREGTPVKKGDVIAQVDPRPFTIQLHTAEAALARDTANLKNAELNLLRYQELRKQDLVAQQQVDDQRATVAQLEAADKSDRAQIENARLQLEYARITSPIDGVTGVRLVDPGNLVHANDANGIVLVTQLDPIAVLFTLPQDELPRVQRAMQAGKAHVDAFARDAEQRLAGGTLEVLDNQVNAQTATIRLKAIFPNADHALWPNQFVKARLVLDVQKDAIVVPAAVIQRGPKGTFAYVVLPDQSVSPRPVEVASVEGESAIVKKGLTPGDVVVTDGQNQLRPGARVAPRKKEAGKP